MNKFQVGIAAEAITAAVFAQAGCNVLVQYGANQPGYDLVVVKEHAADLMFLKTIHVSVKGSQDGGWKLASREIGKSCEEALEAWTLKNTNYIFSFVQFENIPCQEVFVIFVHLRTPFEPLYAFLRIT